MDKSTWKDEEARGFNIWNGGVLCDGEEWITSSSLGRRQSRNSWLWNHGWLEIIATVAVPALDPHVRSRMGTEFVTHVAYPLHDFSYRLICEDCTRRWWYYVASDCGVFHDEPGIGERDGKGQEKERTDAYSEEEHSGLKRWMVAELKKARSWEVFDGERARQGRYLYYSSGSSHSVAEKRLTRRRPTNFLDERQPA